jgi:hypothetical protein
VWVDHPSGRFLIGSPDPIDVAKALEANVKIVQKKHATKKDPLGLTYVMSASEQMLCSARVVAELQLLDWKIEGIKYTKKSAIDALLSDREYTESIEIEDKEIQHDEDEKPEYQSLMAFITEESNRFSNYEALAKEEDVKK